MSVADTGIMAPVHGLWRYRTVIAVLTLRELQSRYAGSRLGTVWALLQPLSVTLIFWFVFSVGFKAQGPVGTSYIVYFLTGYVPWMFFSDILNSSSTLVSRHSYLIKKTAVPLPIIFVVPLVIGVIEHAIAFVILLGVIFFNGIAINWTAVLPLYYFVCLMSLAAVLMVPVAVISVFSRDFAQVIAIALNALLWMSPIIWVPSQIDAQVVDWLKLSPLVYVMEGYRTSLAYPDGTVADPLSSWGFWLTVGVLALVAAFVYSRLRSSIVENIA